MDFTRTPASYALLALFVVVSILGLRVWPQIIERNLLRPYRVVKHREYGPVITHGFIHADFLHLFMNGLTMFFFGPPLERVIHTPKFVALYFIALVLTSLGSIYKHRNNPDYASLGASGAIMAVMFAFIVYYPTSTILYFGIPIPAPLFAGGYVAYSWWASKNTQSRIAHDAHLDGAFVGLLFVAITDFRAWERALRLVFGGSD
jgi:membrane associated rhomboid family serine protease